MKFNEVWPTSKHEEWWYWKNLGISIMSSIVSYIQCCAPNSSWGIDKKIKFSTRKLHFRTSKKFHCSRIRFAVYSRNYIVCGSKSLSLSLSLWIWFQLQRRKYWSNFEPEKLENSTKARFASLTTVSFNFNRNHCTFSSLSLSS